MKKLSLPTSPIAFWTSLLVVWGFAIWAYLEWIGIDDIEAITFEFRARTFEILAPEYFALLLALPLLAVVSRFSLSDLPGYQRRLNLGIRALVVAAIVASLAQIVVTDFDSRISTIYLVDTSASMPDDALDDARDHINNAVDQLDDDDTIEVVAFASRPYPVQPEPDGRYSAIPRPETDGDHYDTDISAAMRMAYGLFPDDHLQRIVLMTDGNQTHGDFLAEVDRAADFGIRLFSQPLDYERPPEVLIQDVDAPDDIDVGAPFYLTARIFSTHADTVDLTLWQDEFRDDERTIDVDAGTTEVRFETEVSEPGFRTFELEMDVHGRDTHDENNRFIHTAYISGEPRILYVEGEMRSRHHLERALGDEDFDIETRTPAGVPRDIDDLDAFDLVLLSDAHADDFSQDQLQLFDTYVRQMGGGLIMAGGENSFGPGGWQETAVEDLMPVTFEGQQRREDPSLAILLVIDRSGSMDEHRRMELAREAARAAVDELDDHAEIGILAFDNETTPITPIQPVTNRARIHNQIDRIQIRGGTDIALALEEAYDRIAFHPARFRHVILLTDGISDEDNIFTETMPAMRIEDITVTTVGLGDGAETSLLRRIADAGNGRFYFTNNPYQVPRIFADETRTVADSAVVEEPVGTRVTGRSQVLDGIAFEQAPYLLGYVPTTPRPEADVLLSTDSGDPLLARWQVGLGRTAAFTSDLKNRWGAEWVRWQGYPQLWAQLIRDTMRTDDGERLPMRAVVDQDRGRVTVDAIGPNDQFINDLHSTSEITSPGGETRRVPLDQTAPGIYEATFELDEFGSYHLSAEHLLDGDSFATSQTSLSYPYPRGLSFTEANDELVERAVEVTGGTVAPTIDELFDAGDEEIRYRRNLWPYLAALALLLLILDVGFRRIRLSGDTDISFQQLVDGR